jgi:hypothetical protein
LAFTGGTLTVRGQVRIRFVDGLVKYGRPYDLDLFRSDGILANPAQIKSVRLLTDADVHEMGLNLPDDSSIDWRSA